MTYVKSRQASPRVRVFVDWLVELFERHTQDANARVVFGNTIASLTASAAASLARRAQNDPELEVQA